MTSHDAFTEQAAGYVLDALDDRERREFETHLASCEACQREVAALGPAVAALGLTVEPVAPPSDLKARVLTRATSQPQLRGASARTSTPARMQRVYPSLAMAAGLLLIVGLTAYSLMLRSEVARLRQMSAEAYTRADQLRDELNGLRRDAARLSNTVDVLSGPDTVKVDLRGQPAAPQAAGRAYVAASRGIVFAASRLPALSPGRVYQLWVIPVGSSSPVGAGVFSVDATGSSTPVAIRLPADMAAVRTVAVTEEPGPTGSEKPTSPILLAGTLGG